MSVVFAALLLCVMAFLWILERGRALAVLEKEQAAGLWVKWKEPSWAKDQPYLARLWPWASLAEARVDYSVQDAAALGDALRHFGSLGSLSVGQGKMDALALLLSHCGEQPRLKSLMIFNVEVDERILPVLARWQGIETLALVPCELTGEGFPVMPRLRSIDMAYAPLNNQGLIRLASSCPVLEDLHLKSTALSSTAILQAVEAGKSHLRSLMAGDVELTNGNTVEDRERLATKIRQAAPGLRFDVLN